MPPSRAARLRLLALWVGVAAHTGAVATVAALALQVLLNDEFGAYRPDVLKSWLVLSAFPVLILSPLIGVLSRSHWSWLVLIGSVAAGVAATTWGALTPNAPWLSVAAVLT